MQSTHLFSSIRASPCLHCVGLSGEPWDSVLELIHAFRQWYTINCLTTSTPGEKKPLIYAVYQFPWCKFFCQHDVIENEVGKVCEQSHRSSELTGAVHCTSMFFFKLPFISNLGDILASICLC